MVKTAKLVTPPPQGGTSLETLHRSLTAAQRRTVDDVIRPRLQQQIRDREQTATGKFRSWREIVSNGSPVSSPATVWASAANADVSRTTTIQFNDSSGNTVAATAAIRQYHPAPADASDPSGGKDDGPAVVNSMRPNPPRVPTGDRDGDGLPDYPTGVSFTGGYAGDLETALATEFMPNYSISAGEQQQFATFGDYVPWTVVNTLGTNPNSYYHVTPLGLGTDADGNQVYAIRVDYLSLWNADGGLVGGDAACLYSYFGIDDLVQQLSGHELDAERSVMLLAAPALSGGYNPDPSAYKLYSLYTAAHEGTFFDQSQYVDFTTPVPAGNHVNLRQSLSKHSTYGFDPNNLIITPQYFIDGTFVSINTAYIDGDIDDGTYAFLIAAASDVFYGCLVEKFGDRGSVAPSPITNVGEVSHPLNGNGFIQDNSARALNLSAKLTTPIF